MGQYDSVYRCGIIGISMVSVKEPLGSLSWPHCFSSFESF